MKFLANENFPFASYKILKNDDWDIEHIGENHIGVTDQEVIEYSKNENRIIITFDSDYGELVFKNNYKPLGVIYLRLKNFNPSYPAQLLNKFIVKEALQVEHKFTVIDENKVRQRNIK